MNAVVIDDEDRARQTTIALIRDLPYEVKVIGEAASVHEGQALIERTRPDLIFLDIQMRDGTGFDLLDRIKPFEGHIIFTTAHDKFALKAFRYHAMDYLLKPIDPDLLSDAVYNLLNQQSNKQDLTLQIDQLFRSMQTRHIKTLALPSQEGIDYIRLDDIVYLNAGGNYTTFCLTDGRKILVTKAIKEYDEILPADTFFRVHQSYIICSDQVKRYSKEDSSVVLSNGDLIPVAKRRRQEFLEWLIRE
jgi:two-component system LytT family response regulator